MEEYTEIVFRDSICRGRTAYNNIASLQNRIINANTQRVNLLLPSEGNYGKTFLFMIRCMWDLARNNNKQLFISAGKSYKPLTKFQHTFSPDEAKKNNMLYILSDTPTINIAEKIVVDIPVKLSDRLQEDMVSRVGEILNNATDHSGSSTIIVSRYPKPQRKYCFVCYDTGVGIPEKVRTFFGFDSRNLNDADAVRWAIEPGNTTAVSTAPRGQGLHLLRQFAELNEGTIRICTGNVLYTYSCTHGKISERYDALDHTFKGTLFEMDINAFDGRYLYEGESHGNQSK